MRTRITLECTECKNRNYNMTKDKKTRVDDVSGKTEKTQKQKKSWFKGLQAEFKKVIWPDKNALVRQTTAVVSVSVLLGAIISVIDAAMKYGVDLLVR